MSAPPRLLSADSETVPDFLRCNACKTVGTAFAYDPNPKNQEQTLHLFRNYLKA